MKKNKTNKIYLGFDEIKSIRAFCSKYGVPRRTIYSKIKQLPDGINSIVVANLQLTIIKNEPELT